MALGDFSPQAKVYAARPGYPVELVDRLVARVGASAGDRVADLGAGTGIFTQLLAARGLVVDAIEPNVAMRAEAPPLPGVRWHDGTFEATGLATASVRWATAAQAFHWADPPRALPELHRVLVPGGFLTCLWNDRRDAESELLRAVMAIIRRDAPAFDELYRARDWPAILVTDGWFGDVATDLALHTIPMPRDRFRNLWRSHNRLAESAGLALPRVLAAIDALTADLDVVPVPYVTRAFTARAMVR
ncbi:MAG: class I SAM-dependent methyltransferase [Deltaproteobacteria bacterium]|nr:class I SAM-dependent methyltransferase [Kofleriaceae bacterium]